MHSNAARNLTEQSLAGPVSNWTRLSPSMNSEPSWRVRALIRFKQIRSLAKGWDSYRAEPIRKETIDFAWLFLEDVMQYSHLPFPSIVPTSAGGIQLEWHDKGIDLELHIAAPYDCEFVFFDHRDNSRNEQSLTNDFSPLERPIWMLAARS